MKAGDYSVVIYDKGCLRAGEEWVERNLIPVAGVAVAMAVLQVGFVKPEAFKCPSFAWILVLWAFLFVHLSSFCFSLFLLSFLCSVCFCFFSKRSDRGPE